MRDVGVQLGAAVGVASGAVLVEAAAALVAEAGAQVVLAAALRTAVGQLAARHGHERALGPFDDLQSRMTNMSSNVTEQKACSRSLLSSMSLMRTSVITTAGLLSRVVAQSEVSERFMFCGRSSVAGRGGEAGD